MKKNTTNFGKLQLNKNTIVKLNNDQMEALKGGLADDCKKVTCNGPSATVIKASSLCGPVAENPA